MIKSSQKDLTVSLTRTTGMICIILCHLFGYGQIASLRFLSEIFNVGTSIFLFISGFLYGEKDIQKFSRWYINRFKRICVPMYIFMAVVFAGRLIATQSPEVSKYFIFLFNLQGIGFIFTRLDYSIFSVSGADHLWFLTVIMLCYLLVPLLIKIRQRVKVRPLFVLASIFVFSLVAALLFVFTGINIFYFVLFSAGFLFKMCFDKEYNWKKYFLISFIAITAISLRLACSFMIQDNSWYYCAIVPISQGFFAVWIFLSIRLINLKLPTFFNSLVGSRLMGYVDKLSFYIYITHFMFIAGSPSVIELTHFAVLNSFFAIALSILTAIPLKYLTDIMIANKKNALRP